MPEGCHAIDPIEFTVTAEHTASWTDKAERENILTSLTGNAAGPSGDGAIATLPSVLPRLLAISLLCSYIAIWLELIEGLIDKLYDHIYEQIYPTADTAADDAPGA